MFEVCANTEWHSVEGHLVAKRDDGFVIKMVVVIMGDDHSVDLWKLIQGKGGGVEAFRPRRLERRGPFGPDGINQHTVAVDLDEERRVAEPGYAKPTSRRRLEVLPTSRENGERGLWHGPVRALEPAHEDRRELDIALRQRVDELSILPIWRRLDCREPAVFRACPGC